MSTDVAEIKLLKYDTKDIKDGHVNGSLTVIWRDWDEILDVEPNHTRLPILGRTNS